MKFEFPLQRWSLAMKPKQLFSTERKMQTFLNSNLQ